MGNEPHWSRTIGIANRERLAAFRAKVGDVHHAVGLRPGFGHDEHARHLAGHDRVGVLSLHVHRFGVDHNRIGDPAEQGTVKAAVLGTHDRERNILRGHGRTVMEGHVVAQHEPPGVVANILPAGCQTRHALHVDIQANQAVINLPKDRRCDEIVGGMRVHRKGGCRAAVTQCFRFDRKRKRQHSSGCQQNSFHGSLLLGVATHAALSSGIAEFDRLIKSILIVLD